MQFDNIDYFSPAYKKFKRRMEEERKEREREDDVFNKYYRRYENFLNNQGENPFEQKTNKLKVIHTPGRKTVEEQRFRPKFRRKELGKITVWSSMGNMVATPFGKYKEERCIKIEVEGEEGHGDVPKSILRLLESNELIVNEINGFANSDFYLHYSGRTSTKARTPMSLRRFLYECVVHSQYIEFEEI